MAGGVTKMSARIHEARRRPVHHTLSPASSGTSANRFGRTRQATATAAPPNTAVRLVECVNNSTANDHQNAAGTSLIGVNDWKITIGEAATAAAPMSAVSAPPSRRPSKN